MSAGLREEAQRVRPVGRKACDSHGKGLASNGLLRSVKTVESAGQWVFSLTVRTNQRD